MADTNQTQNQAPASNTPPKADSPWDEVLPEEKTPDKSIGNFVSSRQPAQNSPGPFKLPQDDTVQSAPAAIVPTVAASTDAAPEKATVTNPSFNYGFNDISTPQQPVVPAPSPAAPVPVATQNTAPAQPQPSNFPVAKSIDSISAVSKPVPMPTVASVPPVSAVPSQPQILPVSPTPVAPTTASVQSVVAPQVPPAPKPADQVPKLVNQVPAPTASLVPTTEMPATAPTVAPVVVAKPKKLGLSSLFAKLKKNSKPLAQLGETVVAVDPIARRKKMLKIGIPLGLIFVFCFLILLTETGIISFGVEKIYGTVGLERLWGGLPKDSEGAIVKSFVVMKSNTDFKINGSLYLNVDKTVKNEVTTPIAGFVSASDNTSQSTDPLYADVSTTKAINTTFAGSLGSSGNDITVKVLKPIGSEAIQLKNNKSDLWVKTDNIKFDDHAESGKWLSYNLSPLKDENVTSKIFSVDSANGFSTEGARDGSEKIGGVTCYRYQLKNLQVGDTLASIGIKSDNLQSVSGTVWIGVKDKLMRRLDLKIIMAMSQPVMQMNLSLSLSDFGVTNSFSVPASTEIVDLSAPAVQPVQTAPVIAPVTPTYPNDQTRKDDLTSIKAALEAYKAKLKAYPIAKTEIKLNNTTNILAKKLVPTYIAALPKDPMNTDGWTYNYKSTAGKTYTLTARLEDASDPVGKMVGSKYLYILTNE